MSIFLTSDLSKIGYLNRFTSHCVDHHVHRVGAGEVTLGADWPVGTGSQTPGLTERNLLSFFPYYPLVPRYRVLVIAHNWLADKLNSLARQYVALP